MIRNHNTRNNYSTYLVALCWLVYSCSYIGKLSYSANINQIGTAFSVGYSQTGMISTFFFFAYGIGQIVNGIMCKRYNVRLVVFFSLIVGAAMNLAVILSPSFVLIKYFWLINGAAMSFLWISLIRLLSETLNKRDIGKAILSMGTTVATGTVLVYSMSAIFAAIGVYHLTFILASLILLAVAGIWIFSYKGLVLPLQAEMDMEITEIQIPDAEANRKSSRLPFFIVILAFFAVANNFVREGLTSWTPDILASLYNTPGWLSILLTLLLPLLAIGGTFLAIRLHAVVKSFIATCTFLFGACSLLIGVVIILLSYQLLPITIACFALVSCLMASVNNVITSMMPLHLKDKFNSGRLAGILNGFCYLGSTLSSYGLGSIADAWGWPSVFTTLLTVSCTVVCIGAVYLLTSKLYSRKGNTP